MNKGVSPLIATMLLVLVAMGIGGLFFSWMYTYYNNELSNQQRISDEQIKCSNAGFQIVSCSFDAGDTNIATILLENTDFVDLNSFTVTVRYSSGESDTNICNINLKESAYGKVYIQLDPGESPAEIKVTSRDCKNLSHKTTNCS
ncbi:MAG: hypothetical protein QXK06_04430 [Candidatus Diapherotrites archaeon]